MATEDATSPIFVDLNPILSDFQHQHKAKRRKALEKYLQIVFEVENTLENDTLTHVLGFSLKPLVTCMTDQSEMNRIKSTNIILRFIQQGVLDAKQLIDIIPVIHHRLATIPQVEESEDVRLLMINVLSELTSQFQEKLIPYINDIVNILKEEVIDSSPEARKAASECVSSYGRCCKEKFHMQSESLVKPLLKALHHQRFRNRIACIRALGDILLYGDSKSIKNVSGPLTQCAMDLPQVRLELITVGADLAKHMPDRYSYWHRILPLLLFGLRDDDLEVKEKAQDLWKEVGAKYEEENMDRLKEEIDFDVALENYPPHEERPGVGCRTLVQQALIHILPGLLTDLDDWQVGPRLHAARLLTVLVLAADMGATQYAEKILTGLYLAAGDKEASVVNQVLECSQYLGHFLEPSTYLPLVLPQLESGNHGEKPLMVLSALVSGTPPALLHPHVAEIVKAVTAEDVAFVSQTHHQFALLQLIRTLLKKCDSTESEFDLFMLLLFIASSSELKENVDAALEQLDVLSQKAGQQNVKGLFCKYTRATLQMLLPSASSWTEHQSHFLMFVGLLELAGEAVGYELEALVKVLSACVGIKQDPYVVLRCLSLLRVLLMQEDKPLAAGGQLETWLHIIVAECVWVFLPWRAGRSAETLRTAAVACMAATCQVTLTHYQYMDQEMKKCLGVVPALIEDEAEDTRLFSCEVIQGTISNYPLLLDADIFYNFADRLVKRFDDVSPRIRLKAATVLSTLFTVVPENFDSQINSARLLALYEAAVIFLDDPDVKLQEAVLVALEKMGIVSPDLLIKTLEKGAPKYRNAHYCYKLIDSMKSLTITTDA